jgi:hypothetical protein
LRHQAATGHSVAAFLFEGDSNMNSSIPAPHFIRAKEIRRRLGKVGAPQFALAYLSDVSDASLSLCLAGRKTLTWEAQHNVNEVLSFFEDQVERAAPLPVDFSNMAVIERLFREWKRAHPASEAVGTSAERA